MDFNCVSCKDPTKAIRDSGWIKVNPLTVLVGKNESGKTSLLRALHSNSTLIPKTSNIDQRMAPMRNELNGTI